MFIDDRAEEELEQEFRHLNRSIGEAIQAYARVETVQASVVEVLLRVDFKKAYAVLIRRRSADSTKGSVDQTA